jgi:predicted nucleotidyltransferase
VTNHNTVANYILESQESDFFKNHLTKQKSAYDYMPENLRLDFADMPKLFTADFLSLIKYSIFTKTDNELSLVYSATEGVHNKLRSACRAANTYDDLIDSIKSKRYTRTRIARLLMHAMLGITKSDMQNILEKEIPYARVLSMNESGRAFLRYIRKQKIATIPVITNKNKQSDLLIHSKTLSMIDDRAADIYNLVYEQVSDKFNPNYDDAKMHPLVCQETN